MDNPLVSIIIPVYNGSNYLQRAIDSALSQTYKNIEIIVVNDGSNDERATEKIALSYGSKIKYISKQNGGVSSALNIGIKIMNGEYFSWLSHDDEYAPEKIEKQIGVLSQTGFNKKMIALCSTKLINSDSRDIKQFVHNERFLEEKEYDGISVISMMLKYGTFSGCAFLIPKEAFEICGLFDETLRYNQDSIMWYKIFLQGFSLVFINYIGVLSRVHNNQLTQTGRSLFHSDCKKSSEFLIPTFNSVSKKENNILFLYAKYNARYNNAEIVDECILIGKDNRLFNIKHVLRLKVMKLYGAVRPTIRRIYHKLFNKVKTQ